MAVQTASTFQPLAHREARLVVWGVMLPVFLSSLDNTIVASALPTIGRSLGDMQDLSWIVTTYLLTSTAVTPLYGKLGDIHGRRIVLLLAIGIFLAGSLACALAPTMLALIVGRGLQGLGSGGIVSLATAILGDIAAPKDRSRYYFYYSATYTTAGAVGPAIGGLFAAHLHWSVIFWINLPLGALGFLLTYRLLRRLPRHDRKYKLDVLGAVLIVAASSAFMFALESGGVRYPWTSAPILVLLGAAIVLASAFAVRLATASEPLIPVAVLSNPIVRFAVLANSMGWGGVMGLNVFLPIYLQSVLGFSIDSSGLALMILMGTLNISAGVGSYLAGRIKHYKTIAIVGMLIAMVGIGWLALWPGRIDAVGFEIALALIGIGFGPLPPISALALQNAVPLRVLGTATSTMNFSRQLYGTMMIALFSAIVLGGASAAAPDAALSQTLVPGGSPQSAALAAIYGRVFAVALASFAAALLAVVLMEERPLKDNASREAE